jgi:hypothetical protein
VDAGGPYAIVEGTAGTLTASGTEPNGGALSYAWDLDLNGTYETSGQAVTFSAADLEAPATRTVGVRATGPTGLAATDTATVTVIWQFDGFAGKNEERPSVNTAKAGANLIVRFALDGDQGIAVLEAGYPRSGSYSCGGAPLLDATEPTAGDLKLAGNGQYSYGWKTNQLWADSCRSFVLKLADGTYHYVDVFFDK